MPLFWTSGDVFSGFQNHLAEAHVAYIPEIHLWCDTYLILTA